MESTPNWFNVFDSDHSQWLTDSGTWNSDCSDRAEFQTLEAAVAAAHAADTDAERTPAVLGDFGNANDY